MVLYGYERYVRIHNKAISLKVYIYSCVICARRILAVKLIVFYEEIQLGPDSQRLNFLAYSYFSIALKEES